MNEKKEHRGICHECGGRVDAHGYASGGDVEEEATDPEPISQEEKRALFAKALKGKVPHAAGRTET